MDEKKSFWTTLPGILTGAAGLLTALTALLAFLHSQGMLGQREGDNRQPPQVITDRPSPTPKQRGKDIPQPPQPLGFRVVEVFLRADPFDYVGPCPVEIKFTGRISVAGGGGSVSYKFLRSDGASAPVEHLVFDSPGSKDILTTWKLGASGSTFSGWHAVRILDPQEQESEKANFSIRCQ